MLVRRWGVLWRPLECSLEENTRIVMVCMKLHNYCQRHGFLSNLVCNEAGEIDAEGLRPDIWFQNDLHTEQRAGVRRDLERSNLRVVLASTIHQAGLKRPRRVN